MTKTKEMIEFSIKHYTELLEQYKLNPFIPNVHLTAHMKNMLNTRQELCKILEKEIDKLKIELNSFEKV